MNKAEVFITTYEHMLIRAVINHPDEYAYDVDKVPEVIERMAPKFATGGFNKDSRAIIATCKELGIKHTYKAIMEYVND